MGNLLCSLLGIYVLCFIARVVLSWFPLRGDGPVTTVAQFLRAITDPLLRPIQQLVPAVRIGAAAVDLSPLIVLIGLSLVQRAVC